MKELEYLQTREIILQNGFRKKLLLSIPMYLCFTLSIIADFLYLIATVENKFYFLGSSITFIILYIIIFSGLRKISNKEMIQVKALKDHFQGNPPKEKYYFFGLKCMEEFFEGSNQHLS